MHLCPRLRRLSSSPGMGNQAFRNALIGPKTQMLCCTTAIKIIGSRSEGSLTSCPLHGRIWHRPCKDAHWMQWMHCPVPPAASGRSPFEACGWRAAPEAGACRGLPPRFFARFSAVHRASTVKRSRSCWSLTAGHFCVLVVVVNG